MIFDLSGRGIGSGAVVEFHGNVPVGMYMSLNQFASAISTRIWQCIARVNWRPFEEARAFVRGLDLKSVREWEDYSKSGERPDDIPSNPSLVYKHWISWGNWLGREWRPFEEARAYARGLGLRSSGEWREYCKSGE